jgi:undecaprenyl-diphosphatase
MTLLQALLLGIVQGLTEFLPVSSSAHLVLVPWILGWNLPAEAGFLFDVLVQGGTLVAVLAYFRRELYDLVRAAVEGILRGKPWGTPRARLAWILIVATIPASIAGVVLKSSVEKAFSTPVMVSAFLVVTAFLLWLGERYHRGSREMDDLTVRDALVIGLWQAVSLFPGISRSGATIAGGLFRGMERAEAARFSFLMSVPVMIGANLIALLDLAQMPNFAQQAAPLVVGFGAAAVVGFASIHWLLRFLTRRPLTVFSVYCLLAGLGTLLLSVVRG